MSSNPVYETRINNTNFLYQSRLGGGGFCEVLRATNLTSFKVVAIKILDQNKPIYSQGRIDLIDKKLRTFMRREAQIMQDMDHINILKCYSFYEDETECFLELELANGGELFDRIVTEHKISEHETAQIISQVLEGLQYMHDKGYVHRDIKPENILMHKIKRASIVKIADMGLSRRWEDKMYTNCGTLDYCAPEIIMNKIDKRGYNKEIDVWSVGVVVYVMLCGYQPFHSIHQKEEALKNEILNCNFRFHKTYWSTISGSAKRFIVSILKFDPTTRAKLDQLLLHPFILRTDTKLDSRSIINSPKTSEHKQADSEASKAKFSEAESVRKSVEKEGR